MAVADAAQRTAGLSSGVPTRSAVAFVVVLLGASWAASWLLGGAGRVVPHWYYFPILFTALRFGHAGALVVALASGLLAGPLTPQLVSEGLAQTSSEWLTRTGFFVAVGQIAVVLTRPALPWLAAEARRRRLERAARGALAADELELWFQPVLRAGGGPIVGAEALLRWQHPDRGTLTAGEFIAELERTAAIHDVGDWVLRRACEHAASWPDEDLWVAVNVSAVELDSAALPGRIARALATSGLPASRLCLEVTETTLVEQLDGSIARLGELQRMGVRIAIDDFGTGYSSLAYVHRLPADILKIDRSFTARLGEQEQSEAIIGGVVILARTLGLETVAEGVERAEQVPWLHELGCDMTQGYHHHHPMPAGAFAALLASGEVAGRLDDDRERRRERRRER